MVAPPHSSGIVAFSLLAIKQVDDDFDLVAIPMF